MTITNHLLAGTLIGLAVSQPELAIVLAYSSHFAMDAIPHFGYPGGNSFATAIKENSKHKLSYVVAILTVITFVALLGFIIDKHRYFALIVGLVAVIPDAFLVFNYWFYERKGKEMKGPIAYLNLEFHGKIQFERPWGVITESVATVLLFLLLLRNI
ncbi:MAG TPA: hypothetical protein VMR76_00670 [Candidatus Saccharimonadia bacterium]|nr:hypothetical protein [Candidatus Saccharimonadia bacterium]